MVVNEADQLINKGMKFGLITRTKSEKNEQKVFSA